MPTVPVEKDEDVIEYLENWVPMKEAQSLCKISRSKLLSALASGEVPTRKTMRDKRVTFIELYAMQRYLDKPV